MASIKSVPFSFVRFEDVEDLYCNGKAKYFLPAYQKHEVKFQFLVDGDLADDQNILLGVNGVPFDPEIGAVLIDYKYKFTLPFYTNPFYLASFAYGGLFKSYNRNVTWEEFFQILYDDFGITATVEEETYLVWISKCKLPVQMKASETGPDDIQTAEEVNYFWHQGYMESPYIDIVIPENCSYESPYIAYDILGPCSNCFNYTMHHKEDENAILGYTNLFNKIYDPCYTSLFTYSCDEDAFDFSYSDGEVNQVRLPFYLSRPTNPQKSTVYVKSNGLHKVLSAFVEKDYLLQTDHMIELFHECMSIALSHDNKTVDTSNIREKVVGIISTDNYLADWNNDFELIEAPAKCKVKVSTFGKTNNNCETETEDCSAEAPPEGGCGDPANLEIAFDSPYAGVTHLLWDPVTGASAYEIDVATNAGPPVEVVGYPMIVTSNSHDIADLTPGQGYTWKVRAICGTEVGNWVDGTNFVIPE